MNKEYILFHLREAHRALGSMIAELENDPAYEHGNFRVDRQHLFHHTNTAWNARDVSAVREHECTEEDFYQWRQFPTDLYMGR